MECICDKQPADKTVYFTCHVHGNMIKGSEVAFVPNDYGYTNIVTPEECNCINNKSDSSWKCPYHDDMIKLGNENIKVPNRVSMREAFEFTKSKDFDSQKEIDFKGHTALRLFFTDGSSVVVQSEYEEDISDVTSGQGIMSPSFYIIT